MAEEKKLDAAALRKAFKKLNERLTQIEKRDESWDELLNTLEYLKKVQVKIDRYSCQVDNAIPRMVAAEAALGRANANHDKLWGLLGENAHSISKLRELMNGDAFRKLMDLNPGDLELNDEGIHKLEQMRDARDASDGV